jgi:hypothetical protein
MNRSAKEKKKRELERALDMFHSSDEEMRELGKVMLDTYRFDNTDFKLMRKYRRLGYFSIIHIYILLLLIGPL